LFYHNKITCFGWDTGYSQLNSGCHKLMYKTACVLVWKWMPTVKFTVMSDWAFKLTFYWTLTPKFFISFPGSFRQYDYGLANLYKYGNLNPPDYNLSIISSFVSLIVGRNDWLASPEVRKSPVGNVFLSTLVLYMLRKFSFFNVHGSVHRNNIIVYKSQQDAQVTEFILSNNCSTCFGRHYHPSSVAQNYCNYSIW
jgi:hypothetical protein